LRDLAILEVATNSRGHAVIKLNGARIQQNIAQSGIYKLWSLLAVLFVGGNTNKISWPSVSRYIQNPDTPQPIKTLWRECYDDGLLAFFAQSELRNDIDAINRAIKDAMGLPSVSGNKHPMRISCAKVDAEDIDELSTESEHQIESYSDLVPVSKATASALKALGDSPDSNTTLRSALLTLVGIEPNELRHHLLEV
jgi:hypothetical protein